MTGPSEFAITGKCPTFAPMKRAKMKWAVIITAVFAFSMCRQAREVEEKAADKALEQGSAVVPAQAPGGNAFTSFDLIRACEDMGYTCTSVRVGHDTVLGATLPVLQENILQGSDSMLTSLGLYREGAHIELKFIRYADAKAAQRALLIIETIRREDQAYGQLLQEAGTQISLAGNILLISRAPAGLADRLAAELGR